MRVMRVMKSRTKESLRLAAARVHAGLAVGSPSPPLTRRFRSTLPCRVILLCGLTAAFHTFAPSTVAAPATPSPSYQWQDSAWRRSTELLVDDALAKLPTEHSASGDAEGRTIAYTRGVLLLNAQPKLQRNIDQARSLLETVRQTRGDDETGLSALYYLARIAQFYADPRDPAAAATLYSELIARAPRHPLAQEAAARLAALRLFEDVPPEEEAKRLAEFEGMADRLTVPTARRDLHFVLAAALLESTADKEGALRHLLAAEEAGIVRQELVGSTLVRIAVLARELGHREVAITHYKKFLASFQRDGRVYMLSEQLKALETEAVPTPTVAPAASAAPPSPAAIPASTSSPPP